MHGIKKKYVFDVTQLYSENVSLHVFDYLVMQYVQSLTFLLEDPVFKFTIFWLQHVWCVTSLATHQSVAVVFLAASVTRWRARSSDRSLQPSWELRSSISVQQRGPAVDVVIWGRYLQYVRWTLPDRLTTHQRDYSWHVGMPQSSTGRTGGSGWGQGQLLGGLNKAQILFSRCKETVDCTIVQSRSVRVMMVGLVSGESLLWAIALIIK